MRGRKELKRRGGARTHGIMVRLSDTGRKLMDILQDYHGLSQASIIEMLLREEARKQGIPIPRAPERKLEESLEARERADALRAQRKASRAASRTTKKEGEEDDDQEKDDEGKERPGKKKGGKGRPF